LSLAEQAMALATELDLLPETGRSLRCLGNALARAGRADEARALWSEAVDVLVSGGFHAEADELRAASPGTG
jgi:hypothetical protein